MTYCPVARAPCCYGGWLRVWSVYRALEYCVITENLSLSAIRTVRVLRPLRAINRIPSTTQNFFDIVSPALLLQIFWTCVIFVFLTYSMATCCNLMVSRELTKEKKRRRRKKNKKKERKKETIEHPHCVLQRRHNSRIQHMRCTMSADWIGDVGHG